MKDCSQNLGPRLRHLSNRITQYMDQQFLALDLTSTQSFILHHLVLHEGEQIYPKDIEKRQRCSACLADERRRRDVVVYRAAAHAATVQEHVDHSAPPSPRHLISLSEV